MTESEINAIVHYVASRTNTFGGGRVTEGNPLSHALKDHPPSFAAGVPVRDVVSVVLRAIEELEVQMP